MNNTQKLIIETTIDIVAEKGLEGFSLREIAKKLDISHTNVYAYYKTKEELLLDCFYMVNEEIASVFDSLDIPANIEASGAHEIFHKVWEKYFNFMIDNGNHSLFYYAYRESDALKKVFMRNNNTTASEMAHFMEEFEQLCFALSLDENVDMDYLFAFLLDGTGVFVKHIIKGNIEPESVDINQVWLLISGGLGSVYKR